MVWALATLGVVTCLTALHDLPLPGNTAMAAANAHGQAGQKWRLVHVLAVDCPCSKAVANALSDRRANPALLERIVLLKTTDDADPRPLSDTLSAAGFTVEARLSGQPIEGQTIDGGPWLLIVGPDGQVAYSGGYAASRPKVGVPLQDLQLLERLKAGQPVEILPAFGCATDRKLQRQLDPLGLKY